MATAPHCDSQVLHAPGECEYCDVYPAWQKLRRMWGIAFTGQPPTDEQPLPCPSEVHRDLDTINRWPGNRPASPSPSTSTSSSPSTDYHTTQLGRPNIPVLKRDLEVLIRDIVKDVLREQRDR